MIIQLESYQIKHSQLRQFLRRTSVSIGHSSTMRGDDFTYTNRLGHVAFSVSQLTGDGQTGTQAAHWSSVQSHRTLSRYNRYRPPCRSYHPRSEGPVNVFVITPIRRRFLLQWIIPLKNLFILSLSPFHADGVISRVGHEETLQHGT